MPLSDRITKTYYVACWYLSYYSAVIFEIRSKTWKCLQDWPQDVFHSQSLQSSAPQALAFMSHSWHHILPFLNCPLNLKLIHITNASSVLSVPWKLEEKHHSFSGKNLLKYSFATRQKLNEYSYLHIIYTHKYIKLWQKYFINLCYNI